MTERPKSPQEIASAEVPIVYVIDDDESMRRGLTNLFESVGLRIEAFGSASELLQRKLPDVPSCLVLDIRLPGMSGLDFQDLTGKSRHSYSHRLYDRSRRYPDVGQGHEGWCG
jgi:response regulator RpfG family c-di-GMP phosphodiesterase